MYREKIAKLAPGYDPAHVEGLLRYWHPVIDALSPEKLAAEVKVACEHIDQVPLHVTDAVAKSFGLRPKKRKATT